MVTRLAARALGYLIAWTLVLALAVAACSALTSGPAAPYSAAPTLAPFPTYAPETSAPAEPVPTDLPADSAAPVIDCGDVDPADPEIDPEWDCETSAATAAERT